MSMSKSIGKIGEVVTITGNVNRKGKKGDVMVFEPRVNGKVVGVDAWFSDSRGFHDGSNFVNSGVKVGDVVSVTGTVYPYGDGKLGIENIHNIQVVGKVNHEELVRMFENIPSSVIAQENEGNHSAPKGIITPDGNVKVFGKSKQVKLAIASLF
jgi:hypothetical protein